MTHSQAITTNTLAPDSEQESRGEGLSEPTLTEECRVRQDLRLVQRAIKRRWPIRVNKARGLVDRLFDITEKTAVTVMTKEGPESLDGPADVNAISAARVLVQMMGQNQSDEHHADDLEKPTGGVNVNVGISTDGPIKFYMPSNGRDKIIEHDPAT